MPDPLTLFLGVLFGAIGTGFFIYGKKQQALVPLFCGLGLMALPYFIANIYLLILAGIVITALPYFIRV